MTKSLHMKDKSYLYKMMLKIFFIHSRAPIIKRSDDSVCFFNKNPYFFNQHLTCFMQQVVEASGQVPPPPSLKQTGQHLWALWGVFFFHHRCSCHGLVVEVLLSYLHYDIFQLPFLVSVPFTDTVMSWQGSRSRYFKTNKDSVTS